MFSKQNTLMSVTPATPDMATKYWDLANQITAFAVLQMLALIITSLLKTSALGEGIKNHPYITQVGIVFGTIVYWALIAHCFRMEKQSNPSHIAFEQTFYARIALVVFTNVMGMLWVATLDK
jgi:hypothetical protein